MDDDPNVKSKVKTEVKDGYVQLAEKMEQVKNQMAKMERKYDELYQSVKEKEHSRSPSMSNESASEASRSPRDSVIDPDSATKSTTPVSSPTAPEKQSEEEKGTKPSADMDLEKMEDNPFL